MAEEVKIPTQEEVNELRHRDFIVNQCLQYGETVNKDLTEVEILRLMAFQHANMLGKLFHDLMELQAKQPKGFQPATFMGFAKHEPESESKSDGND